MIIWLQCINETLCVKNPNPNPILNLTIAKTTIQKRDIISDHYPDNIMLEELTSVHSVLISVATLEQADVRFLVHHNGCELVLFLGVKPV